MRRHHWWVWEHICWFIHVETDCNRTDGLPKSSLVYWTTMCEIEHCRPLSPSMKRSGTEWIRTTVGIEGSPQPSLQSSLIRPRMRWHRAGNHLSREEFVGGWGSQWTCGGVPPSPQSSSVLAMKQSLRLSSTQTQEPRDHDNDEERGAGGGDRGGVGGVVATAVLNKLLPPFLRPQLSSLSFPKRPGGGH